MLDLARSDLGFELDIQGPQFAPSGRASESFLKPALTLRQRVQLAALMLVWAMGLLSFWLWWLEPQHIIDKLWFAINTSILAYLTLTPIYFLAVVARTRVQDQTIAIPPGRVGMVVTKAPSEPFAIVRTTLLAMLAQKHPHDTWLADEAPSEETLAWCRAHGVRVSTRQGRADYHRSEWPRRTRCKEGNLAFFYDHFGYNCYDFVVQLDADHVPAAGYLEEMLRPFADPAVGYVSAPSICDANAAASWSARSRLFAEATLHGALQIGGNNGLAPLCFGSHYAVRTTALRQIGGLGPELAEDHSTTLLMNSFGWKGVHAINAIAHGDGPQTFADLATQEFQWSRSLMTILLMHTPVYLGRLPARLKFQFTFSQIWYPLYSLAMLAMYLLPLLALCRGAVLVNVTYPEFFIRFTPLELWLVVMAFWWRETGLLRPERAKVVSWEAMLFQFARWPWSLCGCFTALVDCLSGKRAEFRVTPKGSVASGNAPLRVLLPYATLSLVSSVLALTIDAPGAQGFYMFVLLNAVLYGVLGFIIEAKHMQENAGATAQRRSPTRYRLVGLGLVVAMCVVGFVMRAHAAMESLLLGISGLAPWN